MENGGNGGRPVPAAGGFVCLPRPSDAAEARSNVVNLDGKWKFRLDPPEGFWKTDFDDRDWSNIKVPAHWEMEGFHSDSEIGGYRLHFAMPTNRGRVKLAFEGVYSGANLGQRSTCRHA